MNNNNKIIFNNFLEKFLIDFKTHNLKYIYKYF